MPFDDAFSPQADAPRNPPRPTDSDAIQADAGNVPPQPVQPTVPVVSPRVVPDGPEVWTLPAVLPPPGDRGVSLPPKAPHPNFWWSLVWCVSAVTAMQLVGLIILIIPLVIAMVQSAQRHAADRRQARDPFTQTLEMTKEIFDSDLVSTATLIAQGLAEVTLILFAWAAIRAVLGTDWKRRLALRRPRATHLVLLLIGFPALMLLNEGVEQVVSQLVPSLKDLGLPFDLEEIMESLARWPWFLALLVIAVGPGIGEELFCRGFLGQGLVGNYGRVAGVVLTSLLFGLIHMIPRQAAFAVLMGIVLHYVYLTSRSLWLSMLLHFLNNGLAVLAMSQTADNHRQFPLFGRLLELPGREPLLIYPAAALLVAAVAWALYQSRTRLADAVRGTWQPDDPGVDDPPPGGDTVAVRPGPDLVSLSLVVSTLVFFGSACYAVWSY
jgi:membrane protease YdiL (CAAX protease family)